jgi:hypothetical protein
MPRFGLSRFARYGAFTVGLWVAEYLSRPRRPDSPKPGLLDLYRPQVDALGHKIGHGNDVRLKGLARKIFFR